MPNVTEELTYYPLGILEIMSVFDLEQVKVKSIII